MDAHDNPYISKLGQKKTPELILHVKILKEKYVLQNRMH